MDNELISETLEALSDPAVARKLSRQVSPLKGVRGTPHAEVARVAAAAWAEAPPTLHDEDALRRLFISAFEDGLVAVGLLASLAPEHPAEVLDIGLSWLDLIDDVETADALGWMVLGPAFAASGPDPQALDALLETHRKDHPAARRALVAMALAFLPLDLQGPAAAPLREKLGQRQLRFVDNALSPLIHVVCHRFLRDQSPSTRKILRRVIKVWVKADPAGVVAWEASVRGGLPKMLSAETKRARNRV